MRRHFWILLAVACAACSAGTSASSVAYRKQFLLSVPVHVVYVNLNDRSVKVTVAMSKRGRGSSELASSIVSRTRPTAAVTGTFFDTRSLLPTGDIVIAGVLVHSGCVGPALCVTRDNRARIIPHKFRSRRGRDYDTILAGGPTLVHDGHIALNPRREGFTDSRIFRPNRRTAAGVTLANKVLLVSVNKPISLHRLARIMLKLGAAEAIMLDGGSSTAMYANGRFILHPARRLTNVLLAYESPEAYRRAAPQLAPTVLTAKRLADLASLGRYGAGPGPEDPWYLRIARSSSSTDSPTLWMLGADAAITAWPH